MRRANLARGVIAGVAGGLIASYAMNRFQKAWITLASEGDGKKAKPATLKVADAVSKAATGKLVPDKAQDAASSAVHYLTGAALGALYGAAAETWPVVAKGAGVAYGTAAWLAVDEGLVPLMGFGPPADEVPAKTHAFGLVSHAVFGMTLDLVRRLAARPRKWCDQRAF